MDHNQVRAGRAWFVSIDLYIHLTRPLSLRPLLPKAGALLADMLGVSSVPELTVHALEDGRCDPVEYDELHEGSSPLFLVSMVGEPEAVGVSSVGEHVALEMGAQRTYLEFALGAALAIALARELGVESIEDDWRFYGDEVQISPEDLLRRLRLAGSGSDYREAAEQLTCRLDREIRSARLGDEGV
jgi:hypothetical protein